MYYFSNIQWFAEPCSQVSKEMRWGYWTQMKAEEALSHLKNVAFPGLVELAPAGDKSSFSGYMKGVV
jgi:hypothetical protein